METLTTQELEILGVHTEQQAHEMGLLDSCATYVDSDMIDFMNAFQDAVTSAI